MLASDRYTDSLQGSVYPLPSGCPVTRKCNIRIQKNADRQVYIHHPKEVQIYDPMKCVSRIMRPIHLPNSTILYIAKVKQAITLIVESL